MRTSITFVLILLCLSPLQAETQEKKKKVRLEGFVYDSADKPLGGVDVSVWVTGKSGSVGGTQTANQTGKYSVEIEVSGAFDISYTMSNYKSSVVNHLAENNNQQISKVMYRKGEKMPPSAAHAYLQSLERMTFLANSLRKEARRDFLLKFPEGKEKDELLDEFKDPSLLVIGELNQDLARNLKEDAQNASLRFRKAISEK
jgi:hypothetical protein